jgi:hypothetical protein
MDRLDRRGRKRREAFCTRPVGREGLGVAFSRSAAEIECHHSDQNARHAHK